MRFQYDSEVDILTVEFASKLPEYAEEVAPGVILALTADDTPVYLEIHDATTHDGLEALRLFDIDASIPLSSLAREYNVSSKYLRRLASSGKIKAKKQGGRWMTTLAWMEERLDNLSKSPVLPDNDRPEDRQALG